MDLSVNQPGSPSSTAPATSPADEAKNQIKGVTLVAKAVIDGHVDGFKMRGGEYLTFVDELIGIATDSTFINAKSVGILVDSIERSGKDLAAKVPDLEDHVKGTLEEATAGVLAIAKDWFSDLSVPRVARGESKGYQDLLDGARSGAAAAIQAVLASKAKVPPANSRGATPPPSAPAPTEPPAGAAEGGQAPQEAGSAHPVEVEAPEAIGKGAGAQAPAEAAAAPVEHIKKPD